MRRLFGRDHTRCCAMMKSGTGCSAPVTVHPVSRSRCNAETFSCPAKISGEGVERRKEGNVCVRIKDSIKSPVKFCSDAPTRLTRTQHHLEHPQTCDSRSLPLRAGDHLGKFYRIRLADDLNIAKARDIRYSLFRSGF